MFYFALGGGHLFEFICRGESCDNTTAHMLCGNGIVEGDEVCDGTEIACEELDSNYVSGTATCNATCDGYNTNNCSDDGW